MWAARSGTGRVSLGCGRNGAGSLDRAKTYNQASLRLPVTIIGPSAGQG